MTQTATASDVIASVYEAFQRGDIPRILGMVAANATWRQEKTVPWGGDYRGPEGAAEFFRKLDATMETVAFDARENIEHGEEVFSFGVYYGKSRATGKTASAEWMFRWRVRDGKVVAWQSYIDTAALTAALS
jgi:ketosteroid isomerase-like protein